MRSLVWCDVSVPLSLLPSSLAGRTVGRVLGKLNSKQSKLPELSTYILEKKLAFVKRTGLVVACVTETVRQKQKQQ